MLDTETIEQLREVFQRLERPVTLMVNASEHEAQSELRAMMEQVASANERLVVEESGKWSDAPSFEILAGGVRTGIRFRGIPGGHEFTSLILAILHSDGKGKLPDAGIVSRIRALKGPIRLTTYMSPECENCPEVVQALNLMASLHPDFESETVDGAVAQREIQNLGIQGVPTVVDAGTVIHSGRSTLLDLLARLESEYGTTEVDGLQKNLGEFDVAVIGGGPAGASAAIYSARKGLRTVLLSEKLGGQLNQTRSIENMISQSRTEGAQLAAQLADHVSQYPVEILEHRRVGEIETEIRPNGRGILLDSGERLVARTIIIATGARWRELGIPGEKEHIGRGVAFCAHCDGPFYRGKRVAVVGGGNSGVEAAIDLAQIAAHVTLVEYGEKLRADEVLLKKLESLPNVVTHTNARSQRILGDGTKVIGLEFEDRTSGANRTLDVDGVFIQIGLLPNSGFVKDLVETTPSGEIRVDPKGRTTVPGIYAAGDVTTVPFKQIVIAMGEGAKVALAAFEDRLRHSD